VGSLFAASPIGSLQIEAAAFLLCRLWLGSQWDAGPARLGKANRNRLLARARAIVAMFEAIHLLADELTGRRGGGFARTQCSLGFLDNLLVRHAFSFATPAPTANPSLPRGSPQTPPQSPLSATEEAWALRWTDGTWADDKARLPSG
jgi:hypothetical protein